MAPLGRPPKPAATKALAGNPGKRSACAAVTAKKLSKLPAAPRDLPSGARPHWLSIGGAALRAGHIAEADLFFLRQAALFSDEAARLRKIIDKRGWVYDTTTDRGAPITKAHPAAALYHAAQTRLSKALEQLGLSPVARNRVDATPEPEKDDLEEHLSERPKLIGIDGGRRRG